MAKKIRVTVEFPFAGVTDIEEYYDLPDGWDEMSEKEQDAHLTDLAVAELENSGVGSGASVVEVPDDHA
jgi:hypothetical protein